MHHVTRLSVFGSAIREDFDPARSDVDFLVEFEPLPEGRRADAYFGLLAELERIFKRPIDLVMASAVRNPYFREAVERSKALVYAS
jgi:predicted nucleotidyltransferase